MKNQKGFILLLTFALMTVITVMVTALIFLITHETRDMGAQVEDAKLLALADAGVERALAELYTDRSSTTQTGIADIRGEDIDSSSSVGNADRMRYEEDGNATINNATDEALLKTFDANYAHSRITAVQLCVKADRNSGGTGATIEVSYSTTGSFPETGNTALTQALTTTSTEYCTSITSDRTWSWSTILSSNFTLRAVRTAGNRDITMDYLFLRVTFEIDTPTEAWYTGTYQTYPLSLGDGTIQSVSIADEQGKVHLNTATQALLRYLMVENGIDDTTANTVAANIVNYRSSNKFDTIEELQQVTDLTSTIYNAVDQDVTVYSYINTYAQDPAGSRAPVNINTASRAVLEAIFDPLTFNNSSDITNLVDAIIAQRETAPFTCFYSSDSSVITDFYDFERSLSYLSNAEDDRVLGNADASALVPRQGGSQADALTTEFSYESSAFYLQSVSDILNRRIRVKTVVSDQGGKTFTTYDGDTTSVGYRKESFESA